MHDKTAKIMIIMLVIVGLFFGAIFGFKLFQAHMIAKFIRTHQTPPVTVSTAQVQYRDWQPRFKAVANLRAQKGVNITSEVGGIVTAIHFKPGHFVKAGTLLVELYAEDEIAQLAALRANAELAAITYRRDLALYAVHAISREALDTAAANLKNYRAQVAQQAAIIAKKRIRAPFSGHLGVSVINLGQYLSPGNKIVSLQSLNPIWVDFFLPEQALGALRLHQIVHFTTDSFSGCLFKAKVSTIDPQVDSTTRNVEIEATARNARSLLLPGMFASVEVFAGKPKRYLTLPQAAISYNPYGNTVFIIERHGQDAKHQPILMAAQKFVTLGETRGDQVAVLKGLKAGSVIVTSGQLKLKNGSQVVINNQVQPSNSPAPKVTDE